MLRFSSRESASTAFGSRVKHVVPADLVGAVGEPVRVAVGRRCEQERGRVRRSARDDDDVAGVAVGLSVTLHDDCRDGLPGSVGLGAAQRARS